MHRPERRSGVTYIGRLAIGPGIVGYGSSGTLVFEGSLDGRQVAVKRVLRQVSTKAATMELTFHQYDISLWFYWSRPYSSKKWVLTLVAGSEPGHIDVAAAG